MTLLKKSPTILLNKNDFYKEIEQSYETLRNFIEKYLSKKIINPEYHPLEVMIPLRSTKAIIELVYKDIFSGKIYFHYDWMRSESFTSFDNISTDDLIDIAHYFNQNEKDKK